MQGTAFFRQQKWCAHEIYNSLDLAHLDVRLPNVCSVDKIKLIDFDCSSSSGCSVCVYISYSVIMLGAVHGKVVLVLF